MLSIRSEGYIARAHTHNRFWQICTEITIYIYLFENTDRDTVNGWMFVPRRISVQIARGKLACMYSNICSGWVRGGKLYKQGCLLRWRRVVFARSLLVFDWILNCVNGWRMRFVLLVGQSKPCYGFSLILPLLGGEHTSGNHVFSISSQFN